MFRKLLHTALICCSAIALCGCEPEKVAGDVFEFSVDVPDSVHDGEDFSFTLKSNRSEVIVRSFSCDPFIGYPDGIRPGERAWISSGSQVFTYKGVRIKDTGFGHFSITVRDPKTSEEKTYEKTFNLYRASTISMAIENGACFGSAFENEAALPVVIGDEPVILTFLTDVQEIRLDDYQCAFKKHSEGPFKRGDIIRPQNGRFSFTVSHDAVAEDMTQQPGTMWFQFTDMVSGVRMEACSAQYFALTAFETDLEADMIENNHKVRFRIYTNRDRFTLSSVRCDIPAIESKLSSMQFEALNDTQYSSGVFYPEDGYVDIVSKQSITDLYESYTATLTVTVVDSGYTGRSGSVSAEAPAGDEQMHPIKSIEIQDNRFFYINEKESVSFKVKVGPDDVVKDELICRVVSSPGQDSIYYGNDTTISDLSLPFEPGKYNTYTFTGGEPGGRVELELYSKNSPSVKASIKGYVRKKAAIRITMPTDKTGLDRYVEWTPIKIINGIWWNFVNELDIELVTWKGTLDDKDRIGEFTSLASYGFSPFTMKIQLYAAARGTKNPYFYKGYKYAYVNGGVKKLTIQSSIDVASIFQELRFTPSKVRFVFYDREPDVNYTLPEDAFLALVNEGNDSCKTIGTGLNYHHTIEKPENSAWAYFYISFDEVLRSSIPNELDLRYIIHDYRPYADKDINDKASYPMKKKYWWAGVERAFGKTQRLEEVQYK